MSRPIERAPQADDLSTLMSKTNIDYPSLTSSPLRQKDSTTISQYSSTLGPLTSWWATAGVPALLVSSNLMVAFIDCP